MITIEARTQQQRRIQHNVNANETDKKSIILVQTDVLQMPRAPYTIYYIILYLDLFVPGHSYVLFCFSYDNTAQLMETLPKNKNAIKPKPGTKIDYPRFSVPVNGPKTVVGTLFCMAAVLEARRYRLLDTSAATGR